MSCRMGNVPLLNMIFTWRKASTHPCKNWRNAKYQRSATQENLPELVSLMKDFVLNRQKRCSLRLRKLLLMDDTAVIDDLFL